MNETIIRPGVVKQICDLTRSKNTPYSKETVNDILTAFFDVVEQAILDGNAVVLNGYMTIAPKYKKGKYARDFLHNKSIYIPSLYKTHIKAGSRLNQAAKKYTERRLKENEGITE